MVSKCASNVVSTLEVKLWHTTWCWFPTTASVCGWCHWHWHWHWTATRSGANLLAIAPILHLDRLLLIVMLAPWLVMITVYCNASGIYDSLVHKCWSTSWRLLPSALGKSILTLTSTGASKFAFFVRPGSNVTGEVVGGVGICRMITIFAGRVAFKDCPWILLCLWHMPHQHGSDWIIYISHDKRELFTILSASVGTIVTGLR